MSLLRLRRQLITGDEGFMLLEMIVAVAVLAALLAVIPRSFVAARVNLDRSQDWLQARLVADTVLTEVLTGPALRPGIRSGSVNGRAWRATLERNSALSSPETETGQILLDVDLSIAVAGSTELEISTMRIGVPE